MLSYFYFATPCLSSPISQSFITQFLPLSFSFHHATPSTYSSFSISNRHPTVGVGKFNSDLSKRSTAIACISYLNPSEPQTCVLSDLYFGPSSLERRTFLSVIVFEKSVMHGFGKPRKWCSKDRWFAGTTFLHSRTKCCFRFNGRIWVAGKEGWMRLVHWSQGRPCPMSLFEPQDQNEVPVV